jgi:hypothetical protein
MNFSTTAIADNIIRLVPSDPISTNTEFKITIYPGLSGTLPDNSTSIMTSAYEFWFTTTYCPLFTTLNRVRLQTGPVSDSLTDDSIYRLIHKNSIDVIDLYNMTKSTNITYDSFGCDWVDVPTIFRRYVECKTAYDVLALLKVSQSMSGGTGNQLKTLGDMTIKYGGGSGAPEAAGDPKTIKDLYNCWNEQLRLISGIKATVKGYYDTSKMYMHPVRSVYENRILRPVIPTEGNFTPGTTFYRGF